MTSPETSTPTSTPAIDPTRQPLDDEIDVFGLTHTGKIRKVNQDQFHDLFAEQAHAGSSHELAKCRRATTSRSSSDG